MCQHQALSSCALPFVYMYRYVYISLSLYIYIYISLSLYIYIYIYMYIHLYISRVAPAWAATPTLQQALVHVFVDGRLGRGDGLGQHEHGGEVGVVPLSCVLDALLSLLSLAGTPSVFTYIDLLTLHINY